MLKIAVIDGQGGGIGKEIIETIRKEIYWDIQVIALGTNSLATAAMVNAGANVGATGENAIVNTAGKVDLILGPVEIIAADAMNGEITAKMACAVADCPQRKLLIPFGGYDIRIAGVNPSLTLERIVEKAVDTVKDMYDREKRKCD